jgi:hypothetical protein
MSSKVKTMTSSKYIKVNNKGKYQGGGCQKCHAALWIKGFKLCKECFDAENQIS